MVTMQSEEVFDGETLRRLYKQYRETFRPIRTKRLKAEMDRIKADLDNRVDEFDRYVVECRLNGATWTAMVRVLGVSVETLKKAHDRAVKEAMGL